MPEERERLRDALVSVAGSDPRVTGAALTGSSAAGGEDRWSDIDLALGIADGADFGQTIADWTGRMYREHGALHHVDVTRGASVYRVFLLASTLQVDLAFSPAAEFGAIAPTFRLLFGTAPTQRAASSPDAAQLIGLGWLHALHARSSIVRGRVWQAEYMVSGVAITFSLSPACATACPPSRAGASIVFRRRPPQRPPERLCAHSTCLRSGAPSVSPPKRCSSRSLRLMPPWRAVWRGPCENRQPIVPKRA